MLFQAPPLDECELEVIEAIDAIRRRVNPPQLQEWPGLTWRAINDRLSQMPQARGEAARAEPSEAVAGEVDDEGAAIRSAAPGYQAALTFVLHLANAAHFRYDEGIVRALHYMIARHDPETNPGCWRRKSVWVRAFPSGEKLYTTPPAKAVPQLIEELLASLNQRDERPSIIRAAMAHLNIAAIHPFIDGNGRLARVLHTLVLARDGVTAPPFASIDEYLSVTMDKYDQVLRQVHGGSWQPERAARPWVRFCLTAHYYQAVMLERRMLEYDRLWETLERELATRSMPERAVCAVAQAALGNVLTSDDYQSIAEVTAAEASRDLAELVEAHLLLVSRDEHGRIYVATDSVKSMRESVRATGGTDTDLDPFVGRG